MAIFTLLKLAYLFSFRTFIENLPWMIYIGAWVRVALSDDLIDIVEVVILFCGSVSILMASFLTKHFEFVADRKERFKLDLFSKSRRG